MHIVGVIHARGNSVRVPLKNIKKLRGIPLIGYQIKAAKKAQMLDKLIVSTDHKEIAKIALSFGAEVPFMRPKEISNDCPSEMVTQHAISFLEKNDGNKIDIAVTFQPTTPFCSPSDIDQSIELLINNEIINSVFSGYEVTERPEWMFTVDKNKITHNFLNNDLSGNIGVVQSLPKLYHPNGGIYATRTKSLFDENALICNSSGIHIMKHEYSIDIDEEIDFTLAEFLLENTKVETPWVYDG